jgi:hypothetical protein
MAKIAPLVNVEHENQAHELPSIFTNERINPDVTATAQKREKTAKMLSIGLFVILLIARNKNSKTTEKFTKLKNIQYPQSSVYPNEIPNCKAGI